MPVRQQNGVEAFELNAEALLAEVRRGINHHVWPPREISREGRSPLSFGRSTCNAASAASVEHPGCAGAEYRDFQRTGAWRNSWNQSSREPGQTPGVSTGGPGLAFAASAATAD